jgi:YedE family putative selenium metabolism protein
LLIVGCAVFIGCPIKLMLRFTAGDFSAIAGIIGLIGGVWLGICSFAHGVELPKAAGENGGSGVLVPVSAIGLLILFFAMPAFIQISISGGGAAAAPWIFSLSAALILGSLAQRSRFCITGSLRDMLLMGLKTPMFGGFAAFVVTAIGTAVLTGRYHPGWVGQPGAHGEHLWSFLGMVLVGWVAVLIGGCPFRQLVKAGEGDTDAGLVCIGMLLGAALVQAWGIAATAAGVPVAGKIGIVFGLIVTIAGVLAYRQRS